MTDHVTSDRLTRHYVNLTNGLEALPALAASGASWSFLRLQSTTIERRDWHGLLTRDVSDDLLMHLALGWRCVLHDRGTLRPLSKTVYFAVPLVKYVLDRRWHGLTSTEVQLRGPRGGPGVDAFPEFSRVYLDEVAGRCAEAGEVRRRLDYFVRYLMPGNDGRGVDLAGESESTERDGDRRYYADLARSVLGR